METKEKMIVNRTWVSDWLNPTLSGDFHEGRWFRQWNRLFKKATNIRYAATKQRVMALFAENLPDNRGKIIRWVCEELVEERHEEDTSLDKERKTCCRSMDQAHALMIVHGNDDCRDGSSWISVPGGGYDMSISFCPFCGALLT